MDVHGEPHLVNRFDLVLVFSYCVAALFLVASVRGRSPGPELLRLSVIPGLAGLGLLAYLLWAHGAETAGVMERALTGSRSIALTAAAAVAAGAVVHFLFTWCLDTPQAVIGALRRGRDSDSINWLRSPLLAVGAAVLVTGLAVVLYTQSRSRMGGQVFSSVPDLVAASFPLPGAPTDLTFAGESSGYISLDIDFFTPEERSEIYRFQLPEEGGGDLRLDKVAEGLSYARGLALLGDTLYVSDQGPLPCEGVAFIQCVDALDPEDGEPNSLRVTRGRLLAFPINPDGSLGESRVVLGDLPVVNSEHSVQDVEIGPDGRVYLSIGGPGQIARDPVLIESTARPNLHLLGTIVSFETDGTDVEVYARGLRNVFQFTFDEEGNLFGAENDGPGARAWKLEEILHIKRGANYGFPYEGTFDKGVVRTDGPLWIMSTVGSSGLEWAGRVGLGAGLLLGSERRIAHLALSRDDAGYYVRSRNDLINLITLTAGNVTVLEAGPRPGQLLAGVYGSNPSRLLLLDFGRAASGSMLALTCTACHGQRLTGMPGLGPDLTPRGNLGQWTQSDFITALRTGRRPDGTLLDAQRMPWLQFAELPDEDLVTLWNYLRSELR